MPRVRNHVNPLRSDYLTLDVPRVEAPSNGRLEVELGCAEADFVMNRARVAPDALVVGVEIRGELVPWANQRCREAGLENARCVFANMSCDLGRMFAPGSVSRFFVNFPDPWWKSKQHKRRVVSQSLIDDMHEALSPEGEIFLETDIFEIALEGMAAMESGHPPRFYNVREPWTFLRENPFGARSRRELHCQELEKRIWRVLYRKLPVPSRNSS